MIAGSRGYAARFTSRIWYNHQMKQIVAPLTTDAHWVYCAFAEELDHIYCKVGITVRPVRRAREIACGAPFDIRRFVFCMMGRHSAAREFERRVATALSKYKTRGEWYRFDPGFAPTFRETIADAYQRSSTRGARLKWTELPYNDYHGNPSLWRRSA